MRTFNQYFSETFSVDDYIKEIKFKITDWNTYDKKFKAIINGEFRDFEFYTYGEYARMIERIDAFYHQSKSVYKTLDYIQKNFAKLIPQPIKEKEIKLTDKFVKCSSCGQTAQISGNKPGTVCPNCGEGTMEIM